MYLKEAHRLTMKAIAGQPDSSMMRLAIRRGLPLIIPGRLRILIESGSTEAIRVTLTILSIYRILSCKPTLKLETITAPFKGVGKTLLLPEILQAMYQLDYKTVNLIKNSSLLDTVKSGPNSPIAIKGSILDAYAFQEYYPHLLGKLEQICKVTGMSTYNLLMKDIDYIPE